jgi:type IV pilus assembly protein PilC
VRDLLLVVYTFTMPKYTYIVQKGTATVTETMVAKDRYTVFQHVREEGGKLISMEEEGQSLMARVSLMMSKFATVSNYEVIIFARTLSAMLVAGLPLSRALSVSERQVSNGRFKAIINAVSEKIKGGAPLNVAFAEHTVFSPLFIAMVRAGEESGALPNSLSLIADQLERGYKLKKQIKGWWGYHT